MVTVDDRHVVMTEPTVVAVQMAASLGRAYGAAVRLIHATPQLQTNTVYSGPVSLPSGLIQEIHERARATSMAVLQEIGRQHGEGLALEFAVRPGHALATVLEEAKNFRPDLIVMAASGRSRVARFFVGSTADRMIRQASCPVMVIPADER